MDFRKVVNIICLIAGIAVLVFGIIVYVGMIPTAAPQRAFAMFFLGGIIVLWSLVSMRRHR